MKKLPLVFASELICLYSQIEPVDSVKIFMWIHPFMLQILTLTWQHSQTVTGEAEMYWFETQWLTNKQKVTEVGSECVSLEVWPPRAQLINDVSLSPSWLCTALGFSVRLPAERDGLPHCGENLFQIIRLYFLSPHSPPPFFSASPSLSNLSFSPFLSPFKCGII